MNETLSDLSALKVNSKDKSRIRMSSETGLLSRFLSFGFTGILY